MQEEGQSQDGVSVHTGFPNPAIDQRLQTLNFNKILVRNGASTYMFRLRGNEWEGVGIFDDDIAVVDRALDPKKIDVVLWWNESRGEFSISKYTDMPKEAACWGVVTSTIHQLRKD